MQHYAGALLAACGRKAPAEQQKRNRACLMALAFLAKLEQGAVQQPDAAQQKHLFNSWPYSVHIWSLYSRYDELIANACTLVRLCSCKLLYGTCDACWQA